MPLKVTISERAQKNLDQIVVYLEQEWSSRIRDKYLNLLARKVKFISENPLLFQASSKSKAIRRCVLNKQTALYYRVRKDEIEIVTIQHTRSNDRKLKF
jgi:plasmid stabilization system protein ParE